MDSVRINYNKCGEQSFSSFIKALNKNKEFIFCKHSPADSTVMQDRYTYKKNSNRVSIVYETKAQTLIITAPEAVMGEVTALVPRELKDEPQLSNKQKEVEPQRVFVREQKKDEVKTEKTAAQTTQKREESTAEKTQKQRSAPKKTEQKRVEAETAPKQAAPKKQQDKKTSTQKTANQKAEKKEQSAMQANEPAAKSPKVTEKTSEKALATKQKKASATKPKKEATAKKAQAPTVSIETKPTNTFTIKKVAEQKFNELLKNIKANKSMRYKLSSGVAMGERAYTISSQTEKAIVKYAGGNVQLVGSRGDLYSELQLLMSQMSDYKTAIKTHIKLSGEEKRAQDIERQLKKKLPAAFEFLSEQSKIDLAIGIIDINNSAVVLSDYSTLLIPCFRGLERLIFDLQHAQGIVVKMIGQAYEKEDGSYVLKSGYRKKIPSVIYAEVMASLYTEYFKYRNFYSHSDGGFDNVSRVISDKQQVLDIFNHIMDVINYNGKKLQEIRFRIS
ncbi:MAG: type II toxin-antitoxin system RnlA family toxin [Clostridia bacterium]|nr:type II toxin-antitoxin system RnlA family toxin [Clostridia bacterium]